MSTRQYKKDDTTHTRLTYLLHFNGPLIRYVNCGLRINRECLERFPRHQLQRKPLVSDPGMHHDTCVTHVPWCMSRSLTHGGGENVPGIPCACAALTFTYLTRGPCKRWFKFVGPGICRVNRKHDELMNDTNGHHQWVVNVCKGSGLLRAKTSDYLSTYEKNREPLWTLSLKIPYISFGGMKQSNFKMRTMDKFPENCSWMIERRFGYSGNTFATVWDTIVLFTPPFLDKWNCQGETRNGRAHYHRVVHKSIICPIRHQLRW